ncbi:class I SAM-dependent methyltransferase [Singulisphaera acidiphila]|uniref:Methylase involved in ubiquinone/menaquinone biosynthesis n=1 Tax=Singulisphaera acidiphila (strain ATCC BAA-1392 / DSM 18658 / VKM B-2454 / MOB10) TaxID=886293 RepID=L0DIS2_SINAD|nr:class I SAM-dependent methyltransferase [Singulisphaera acidiphila]AGA28750.1 methylase involved in ubiquinone/menaquinone biosynthesis [Singulisphaera acidiphila DSM 18658]
MSQASDTEGHRQRIVDQFTRQAVPFREMPAHSNEDAFRLVLQACKVSASDRVLDLACGPGLTACEFAELAAHVTGVDLTPAMIEQARALQSSKGLDNLAWQVGDVGALPFPDNSFSLVFTRYSFHHLLDPKLVLAEMVRVCEPGGRVVVVDVYSVSPEQAAAYDQVELLRDPSHVRALGLDELEGLFDDAGLEGPTITFDKLGVDLEELLAASFPNPGAADEIRRIFTQDLGVDRLGVGAHPVDGRIRFAFPLVILAAQKPA